MDSPGTSTSADPTRTSRSERTPSPGSLLRASVLALLTGASITVFLHESSHSVAGALLGYRPTQVPFAVGYEPEPSTIDTATTAITGPLFSLASGLVGVVVDRLVHPFHRHPYWQLVWLALVFTSLQTGVGYFLITGLIPAGDTGSAFTAWGLPTWAYFVATGASIAGQVWIAWLFSEPMSRLTSTLRERRTLSVYTWIWGTLGMLVLTTLYLVLTPSIGLGGIVGVLAGTIACCVYAPMSMMFRSRTEAPAPFVVRRVPLAGLAVVIVIVAGNVVLTRGLLW